MRQAYDCWQNQEVQERVDFLTSFLSCFVFVCSSFTTCISSCPHFSLFLLLSFTPSLHVPVRSDSVGQVRRESADIRRFTAGLSLSVAFDGFDSSFQNMAISGLWRAPWQKHGGARHKRVSLVRDGGTVQGPKASYPGKATQALQPAMAHCGGVSAS